MQLVLVKIMLSMQMHAAYVNAVQKTKQLAAQAPQEDADVEELRSKAVEQSRFDFYSML